MTRSRLTHVSTVPHDTDEVSFHGHWKRTWSEDSSCYTEIYNDWGVLIYSKHQKLRNLRQYTEIYCDGTFRSCPKPYAQEFTIQGRYRNKVLCFVNCLMTDCNNGNHLHGLQILTVKIRQITGRRWRLRKVICDFELALLAAVETDLPHAQISGCYFYLNHSLWRKVQNLVLAASYRRQPALWKTWLRWVIDNFNHVAIRQLEEEVTGDWDNEVDSGSTDGEFEWLDLDSDVNSCFYSDSDDEN
ncbi:unnamed protein product [Mytilus coruscus]|uniref:MULE transposase domain-containing protein n=1 Tax=Mytilus coruscus TaxID=42192 RepID=A0A6J8EE29_MYTCO|nr:unnamed protein product [Mytilus coruscus]